MRERGRGQIQRDELLQDAEERMLEKGSGQDRTCKSKAKKKSSRGSRYKS